MGSGNNYKYQLYPPQHSGCSGQYYPPPETYGCPSPGYGYPTPSYPPQYYPPQYYPASGYPALSSGYCSQPRTTDLSQEVYPQAGYPSPGHGARGGILGADATAVGTHRNYRQGYSGGSYGHSHTGFYGYGHSKFRHGKFGNHKHYRQGGKFKGWK